jgi:hypothetical protein
MGPLLCAEDSDKDARIINATARGGDSGESAPSRKNLRVDDQFGHPFSPYLVKGDEH